MTWDSFKSWLQGRTAASPAQVDTPLRVWPTLDDRQKAVYEEWRRLWESGGNLAIMMELDRRIYELEQHKEKNK